MANENPVAGIFYCSLCHKNFASSDSRRKHILVKHFKEAPFICDICGKAFKIQSLLKKHGLTHDNKCNYKCICGKEYSVHSSYYSHIRSIHHPSADNQLKCSICEKLFRDLHGLEIHKKAVHDEKIYACSFPSCNKLFSTISLLNAHKRYHSKEKFLCKTCGKLFRKASYLEKHVLDHRGMRSYQCLDCGKTYMNKSHLNQHIKRAHKEASFCCSICGKRAKTKEQIKQHEFAHKGEKPFECSLCNYRTSYSSALTSHRKSCHGDMLVSKLKVAAQVVQKSAAQVVQKNAAQLQKTTKLLPGCGEIDKDLSEISDKRISKRDLLNKGHTNENVNEEKFGGADLLSVLTNTESSNSMFQNQTHVLQEENLDSNGSNSTVITNIKLDNSQVEIPITLSGKPDNRSNLLSPLSNLIVSPKAFLSSAEYPNTSFSTQIPDFASTYSSRTAENDAVHDNFSDFNDQNNKIDLKIAPSSIYRKGHSDTFSPLHSLGEYRLSFESDLAALEQSCSKSSTISESDNLHEKNGISPFLVFGAEKKLLSSASLKSPGCEEELASYVLARSVN